jgi:hypothetical protein
MPRNNNKQNRCILQQQVFLLVLNANLQEQLTVYWRFADHLLVAGQGTPTCANNSIRLAARRLDLGPLGIWAPFEPRRSSSAPNTCVAGV